MAESDHSYPYSFGEEEEGQGTCQVIMPQQVRRSEFFDIFGINIDCDYSSAK